MLLEMHTIGNILTCSSFCCYNTFKYMVKSMDTAIRPNTVNVVLPTWNIPGTYNLYF